MYEEVVIILSYRLDGHGCIQPHTCIHRTFMITVTYATCKSEKLVTCKYITNNAKKYIKHQYCM